MYIFVSFKNLWYKFDNLLPNSYLTDQSWTSSNPTGCYVTYGVKTVSSSNQTTDTSLQKILIIKYDTFSYFVW